MILFRPLALPWLKPFSLLMLRAGTGLLLAVWGMLRLMSNAGPSLSERYYSGVFGGSALQLAYGGMQIVIGTLVVLGLFRRIVYPLQAAILIAGAAMIGRYLADPLGLYLMSGEDSQILFFPSITLAAATLVLLAFANEDRFALDRAITR
jgi:uncharacterized membrane protein YphA (DoxX/SURF4 family)